MMEQKTTAIPRKIKIVLGISLALNLAVAGVIAGAALRKGGPRMSRIEGGMAYARPYIQALPKHHHHAFVTAMRAEKKTAAFQAQRALYLQLLEVLRAQDFDGSALQALVQQQSEIAMQGLGSAQGQWLRVVSSMSDPERQAYADEIESILERKGKRRR